MLGRPPSVDPGGARSERVGDGGPGRLLLPPERRARAGAARSRVRRRRAGTATCGPTRVRPAAPAAQPPRARGRPACRPTPTRAGVVGRRRPGRRLPRAAAAGGGRVRQDGVPLPDRRDHRRRLVATRHDPSGSFTGLEVTRRPTDPIAVLEAHAELSTPPAGHVRPDRWSSSAATRAALDTLRGCLLHGGSTRAGRHDDRPDDVRRTGGPRWSTSASRSTASTPTTCTRSSSGSWESHLALGRGGHAIVCLCRPTCSRSPTSSTGCRWPSSPRRGTRGPRSSRAPTSPPQVKALQEAVDGRVGGQPAGAPRGRPGRAGARPSARRCARRRRHVGRRAARAHPAAPPAHRGGHHAGAVAGAPRPASGSPRPSPTRSRRR